LIEGFCVDNQPEKRNIMGLDMLITGRVRAQLVIRLCVLDYAFG
jgi:hypothetical protein